MHVQLRPTNPSAVDGFRPNFTAENANLDILRASAVLLVVAAHIAEASGLQTSRVVLLGHTGVMLFFVHTALVLMLSLDRLEAQSSRLLTWRFYLKRVFRIYPLPVFVLVSIVVVARYCPGAHNVYCVSYTANWTQLLANLFLVQNLFGVPNILPIMWSLPPEVQMYVTLPFFHRYRHLKTSDLIVGWSVVLIASSMLTGRPAEIVRYVPCFIQGIIAYKIISAKPPALKAVWFPLGIAAPILISLLVGRASYLAEDLLSLAVGLLIPHFAESTALLVNSVAKNIARYSYGIYLAHSPLLLLAFTVGRGWPVRVKIGVFLVSVAAVSVLLFHGIEKPALAFGGKLATRLASDKEKQLSVTATA